MFDAVCVTMNVNKAKNTPGVIQKTGKFIRGDYLIKSHWTKLESDELRYLTSYVRFLLKVSNG